MLFLESLLFQDQFKLFLVSFDLLLSFDFLLHLDKSLYFEPFLLLFFPLAFLFKTSELLNTLLFKFGCFSGLSFKILFVCFPFGSS